MSKPVLHAQTVFTTGGIAGTRAFQLVGAAGTINNGQTREFLMPDDGNGPSVCPIIPTGSVRRINTVGNPSHSVGNGANIGGTNNGRARYEYTFPYPIDVVIRSGSLNGNGFMIIRSRCDEFHRTKGQINRVSAQDYTNLTFNDGNASGAQLFYRDVTFISIELDSANGLSSGFSIGVLKSPVGYEPIQCRVPFEHVTPCGAGLDPVTELWSAQTNYAPNWFEEKAHGITSGNWEYSDDSGVTWGTPPAVQGANPALHAQRWRLNYTVPDGFHGHYRMNVRAASGRSNVGGQYWYDGTLLNTQRILAHPSLPYNLGVYRDTSDYMPVEAGNHTFEFRVGTGEAVANDIGLYPDYRGVHPNRRGFQRLYCVDAGGTQVGLTTDINHDGTPYVASATEDEFKEVY